MNWVRARLLGLMVVMLFLVRSTLVPRPLPGVVTIWILSFFVVLATLATLRFPHHLWPRMTAAVAAVALLLVPPTPQAWLGFLPDAVPAVATLLFLAVLVEAGSSPAPDQDHSRTRRRANVESVVLSVALVLVASSVEAGRWLLPNGMGSWLEWQGAWGPVLASLPWLLLVIAIGALRVGLAPQHAPPEPKEGGNRDG